MVCNRFVRGITFAGIAALIAFVAAPVSAQVASVIAPPKVARAETTQAQAKVAAARRDTTVAARLLDMKSWVDSASGVAIKSMPAAATSAAPAPDTSRAPITSADTARASVRAKPARTDATSFKDGAAAPATATLLPLAVLAGLILLGAGVLLIRAPRGAKARR